MKMYGRRDFSLAVLICINGEVRDGGRLTYYSLMGNDFCPLSSRLNERDRYF